jgi:hypothetical protein
MPPSKEKATSQTKCDKKYHQENYYSTFHSLLNREYLLQFAKTIIANRLVSKILQYYALFVVFWCILGYEAVYFFPSDSFELSVGSCPNMRLDSLFNICLSFCKDYIEQVEIQFHFICKPTAQ